MLNNDVESTIDYLEITDSTTDVHETNKITLLGLRKSIIVCQIIDGLYEILVYIYLTEYYFFASLLYGILFWNTINFYKNNVPFYIFTILIKFSIKITILIKIKFLFVKLISLIFMVFNFFWFKIAYVFYNNITYIVSDEDIESIHLGWKPRIIKFVY